MSLSEGSQVLTEFGIGHILTKEIQTGKWKVELNEIPITPLGVIESIHTQHGGIFINESSMEEVKIRKIYTL